MYVHALSFATECTMLPEATGWSLGAGFPHFDFAVSSGAAVERSNVASLCVCACVCLRASQIQCTDSAGRSLPTSPTTTDSNYLFLVFSTSQSEVMDVHMNFKGLIHSKRIINSQVTIHRQ